MGISRLGSTVTAAVGRAGAVALIAGLLASHAARAEGSHFRKAMAYSEARDVFRRLGYQPYFMPGADICDPDDPRCYPELESCAKSRTFACTYTWRRGKAIVEVETRYDHPVVARSECIVNCVSSGQHKPRATERTVAARTGGSRAE